MRPYPKKPYSVGKGQMVLTPNPVLPKPVRVKQQLAGNVIVIHGVNDVGVSYEEVEKGLCAGLGERVGWKEDAYQPASYRMPGKEDEDRLEEDPDAVFFKREIKDDTHSPVIPFYWGYSDTKRQGQIKNGQAIDRFGNRLDKDRTKGGGPFANATTSLPELWARGAGYFGGIPDAVGADPLRPVMAGPGRMYMVLAAKRLAMLATLIRKYDVNEMVSVVAHSQGCLVSLLAQAFLLQEQRKPIDTLVLTHPPYSLEPSFFDDASKRSQGGEDEAMRKSGGYAYVDSVQNLNGRLKTLAGIVNRSFEQRDTWAWFADVETARKTGIVSSRWQKEHDRDNRGKVYLYFSPEDMTVALSNIQGIGWQGVADQAYGWRLTSEVNINRSKRTGPPTYFDEDFECEPLKEMGEGFRQRVFTNKQRPDDKGQPGPVLVGQGKHDFVLRLPGEDPHAHVERSQTTMRGSLPKVSNSVLAIKRQGMRTITGEELVSTTSEQRQCLPYRAQMHAGGIEGTQGRLEKVDPIDAAIAVTSDYGAQEVWTLMNDPSQQAGVTVSQWRNSPAPQVFAGLVGVYAGSKEKAQAILNESAQRPTQQRKVMEAHLCIQKPSTYEKPVTTQRVLVKYRESADEVRLRLQKFGTAARSFHGAIFASASNHRRVSAYDVSIGQGKACSNPAFYRYLCAVADWRLKKPPADEQLRPGILLWANFLTLHGDYYETEAEEVKALIEGNCDYYSTGQLPQLPVLPEGLPPVIVCENVYGQRVERPAKKEPSPGAPSQTPLDGSKRRPT